MNWKFWKRKKKTVAFPTFTIEELGNGQIYIRCKWPVPKPDSNMPKRIASTMYLLSTGELIATMYQAVAVFGDRNNMSDIAGAAIDMAQKAMTSRSGEDRDEELVVNPSDALRPS